MNYNVHLRIVRDAWNFLKYYAVQDPESHGTLTKQRVIDALKFFYDLETEGWRLHNPTEFGDPAGSSALKDKVYYVNRNREHGGQYEPSPASIYYSVKDVPQLFQPSSIHPDQVGCILGYQAAHVDDLNDTWEENWLLEVFDDLADAGVEIVNTTVDVAETAAECGLAPFYGIVWAICRLFGGCDDWPAPGDVIPDIPEIPDPEIPYGEGPYTEVLGYQLSPFWHFLNMVPLTSIGPISTGNHAMFDDHDGYYYSHGLGSWEEFGIELGTSLLQSHLIPEYANDECSTDEHGPCINYQILPQQADDDHQPTFPRSPLLYGLPPLLSVPFNPVDNMAKYGWDRWKATRKIFNLGYVLHPIVDCATAHHTACTLFCNHSDYESHIEDHYGLGESVDQQHVLEQDKIEYEEIFTEVHAYMDIVKKFWAADPSRQARDDLPIRNMLTELSRRTWEHSLTHGLYDDIPKQSQWTEHGNYVLKQAIAVTAIVLVYAPRAT